MNSKKKLIIAFSAFALIVISGIISVVAVLAAQNVTIKSNISVTYTSHEVAGVVTAHYQVKNGTKTKLGGDTNGAVSFDGSETGDDATEDMTNVTITGLSSANNYIDFIFTFTNAGSAAYTATLTAPTTVTNFTTSVTKPTGASVSNVGDYKFTLAGNTTTPVTYTIRYTITEVAKNSSINGNFSWSLVAN